MENVEKLSGSYNIQPIISSPLAAVCVCHVGIHSQQVRQLQESLSWKVAIGLGASYRVSHILTE